MNLPEWIIEEIKKYVPPSTGRLVIALEIYQGGVTKLELGNVVRLKPPHLETKGAVYEFHKA